MSESQTVVNLAIDYITVARSAGLPVDNKTKFVISSASIMTFPIFRGLSHFTEVPFNHNPVTIYHNKRGLYNKIIRCISQKFGKKWGQYRITTCDCIMCRPYSTFEVNTKEYTDGQCHYFGFNKEHNLLVAYIPRGINEPA